MFCSLGINIRLKTFVQFLLIIIFAFNLGQTVCFAQTKKVSKTSMAPLTGRIEQEDFRLKRNINVSNKSSDSKIQRESMPPLAPSRDSLVDSNAYAAPLSGKASNDTLSGSAVKADDFARLPKGFDIGADKSSRELVLAWEKWHKQLAAAIYQVWNGRAQTPGRAVLKITVYRNRIIAPQFLTCTGDAAFQASIISVFNDINGNPGLSFPAQSERQKVSFEAEYVAGTNVDPGYSWLKGDYEKVRHDYD